MATERSLTDVEADLLVQIDRRMSPVIKRTIGLYLMELQSAGFDPKVATSALSLSLIANAAKALSMGCGVPVEKLLYEGVLEPIASKTLGVMAHEVDAMIKKMNFENAARYAADNN